MSTIIGLNGGSGDDELTDEFGSDVVLGGAGNDRLLGLDWQGAGESNVFDGGAGDDTINLAFSFTTGDTIIGGTGNDDLTGTVFGADMLVFNFAFETTPGSGPATVTRNFFEDTGTVGKTDWTQSELVRTYSAWLREHFGDAAAEAWKQNDSTDPLHLEGVDHTLASVDVAPGARTKLRWIADTITTEGEGEGPGSATLTGHDGTDNVFSFGTTDTLVLRGFGAFDTGAADGVQLDDVGLELLEAAGMTLIVDLLVLRTDPDKDGVFHEEFNDQADTRLSWTGGSITLWDVALGTDGDLGSFLQSGQVQLLA